MTIQNRETKDVDDDEIKSIGLICSDQALFFVCPGYSEDLVQRICPKCSLITGPARGQFDLKVSSVRLEEDEEYECQVLPAPNAAVKVPLRAPAFITVQGEAVLTE